MSPVKVKGGGWSSLRSRILGCRAPYTREQGVSWKWTKSFLRCPSAPLAAFVRRAPHSTAARAGARPTSHYLATQTSLLPASVALITKGSRMIQVFMTLSDMYAVCPQVTMKHNLHWLRCTRLPSWSFTFVLLATIAKTEAPFLHLHFAR